MQQKPSNLILLAFNFLFFALPLYFRFDTTELFEFNKIILLYIVTTVIASLWAYKMVSERKIQIKRSFLDLPILLFLASQFFSTVFSIDFRTSLLGYYSRFNGGLVSIICYVILYYAFVSNIEKKHLKSIFYSLYFSATLVAIYAVLEHFGHSFSCLIAPIEPKFDVQCWRQDVQSRVFATFGQPNWLAAYFATLLPFGIFSIFKNNNKFDKIFFSTASFLIAITIWYTKSRSGILAVFASIIFFIMVIALQKILKNHTVINNYLKKYFVFFTITIITLSGAMLYKKIADDVQNFDTQKAIHHVGGTDSADIRKIVWFGAYKVFFRYPIIGSGVETFAYSYYQDRDIKHNYISEWDFLYNKAHNELINYLATTGIIGIFSYLFFILTPYKLIFSEKKASDIFTKENFFSLTILTGLFAQHITNFFGFSTVGTNLLLFTLSALLVVNIENLEKKDFVFKKEIPEIGITFSKFVILFIFLFSSFRIYNYLQADKNYAMGTALFEQGQYEDGINLQLKAIKQSPNEALLYDNLSENYAQLAMYFYENQDATNAGMLAQQSLALSEKAFELNNRHLNFYKTRIRILLLFSTLDNSFKEEAKKFLELAMTLSPTDPRIPYMGGLLYQDEPEEAIKWYQKTIELKENFDRPRMKLAEIYEAQGKIDLAILQYQYLLDNVAKNDTLLQEKIKSLSENK